MLGTETVVSILDSAVDNTNQRHRIMKDNLWSFDLGYLNSLSKRVPEVSSFGEMMGFQVVFERTVGTKRDKFLLQSWE